MQKLVDGVLIDLTADEIAERETLTVSLPSEKEIQPTPTKEQLLAQLQALQAQIQALE